ncbi:MAG: cytochrome o ubiquinol oxidase subunit IV [Rhodobacteraceae bacterium]|nr:cytochrome o ubiquinol oxidase subunit IV [Paracoccaceae bacterium]
MDVESSHAADPHHEDFAPHGTLKGYLTGFVLSVILTAIPFLLVMTHAAGPATTAVLILAMALIQIVVHMVYFLHLNTRTEGGWTFLATIFTIVLVVIAISGSIWVMYNLDINMMPMPGNEIGQG